MTLPALGAIVMGDLKMDMRNSNASSRMKNLFVEYQGLLRRHGLEWLAVENQKVCVQHIISFVCPTKLRSRLESDLAFFKHELKKDLLEFFKPAQRLSDAFQLVDSGARDESTSSFDRCKGSGKWSDESHALRREQKPKTMSDEPICLWAPHRKRGIRNRLENYQSCPKDGKK